MNPDRELRRVARERGWPVVTFDRPVALRSRVRLTEHPGRLAALAAGTAAVVGSARAAERRRAGIGVRPSGDCCPGPLSCRLAGTPWDSLA